LLALFFALSNAALVLDARAPRRDSLAHRPPLSIPSSKFALFE